MIGAISTARQRRDLGFTLIELLVVVIILGIISAVVVFAVRGSGDKGKAAALGADERAIRVAEETYCARKGTYAPMGTAAREPGTLVGERFLSEPSTYHDVEFNDTEGPCNGTRYRIVCRDGSEMPRCGVPEDGASEQPEQAATCAVEAGLPVFSQEGEAWDRGEWCKIAVPDKWRVDNMLQLSDGKVVAVTFTDPDRRPSLPVPVGLPPGLQDPPPMPRADVYDPAANSWAAVDPPPETNDNFPAQLHLVLTGDGDPAKCAARCNKVLAHHFGFEGNGWMLFDVVATPGEQWEFIDGFRKSYSSHAASTQAIELLGGSAKCASNCGKVFMVAHRDGSANPDRPSYTAEIFDPKDASFTPIPFTGDSTEWNAVDLVRLKDGRVLIVGRLGWGTDEDGNSVLLTGAKIYNPLGGPDGNGYISDLPPPSVISANVSYRYQRSAVLPNGDVFFLGHQDGSAAELYRPGAADEPNTLGRWISGNSVRTCATNEYEYCHVLATLPDGRVLAFTNEYSSRNSNTTTGETFVLKGGAWSATGALNEPDSALSAVFLDPVRGGCGDYCGMILAAGKRSAELYKP